MNEVTYYKRGLLLTAVEIKLIYFWKECDKERDFPTLHCSCDKWRTKGHVGHSFREPKLSSWEYYFFGISKSIERL